MENLMAKVPRKCVRTTDKRVRMQNEILICDKLVKMYALVKSFAKALGLQITTDLLFFSYWTSYEFRNYF